MVQVKIKKKGNKTAILISFDTMAEAFESPYERNKFFAKLHGRKQIVIKGGKRYEYRRQGLLGEIPNLKVDNSVFIIMEQHMRMMEEFFNRWREKVMFKSFPVLLEPEEFRELKNSKKGKEIEVE